MMRKIFVTKKSQKYILSGAKPRVKNIKNTENKYTNISWNIGIKKNKKEEIKKVGFKKGEVVSIFYKKKLLAIGEFLEDFSQKNYLAKNNDEKYQEKEIIKLKKVFC